MGYSPESRPGKDCGKPAARQSKSQAALMAEALNMLFAQYGESEIAKA
jgi:hypothetical protein